MVATHLPQKACDPHVISFTRPSSRLTNSFFPASKIVIAKESEREGLGTRLVLRQVCCNQLYPLILIPGYSTAAYVVAYIAAS